MMKTQSAGGLTRSLQLPRALSLEGKTIVLTGAASGIGRAAASTLTQMGARLVINDLQDLAPTAAEVRAQGGACEIVAGNLTDDGVVARITERDEIDGLIHCAGYYPRTPWREQPDWQARFHRSMDVNVRVPLNLATACIDRMPATGGAIVLIGSVAGRNGGTSASTQPDYAISKGALHTLVRWLSRQVVRRGIHVNAVAPGPIDTPMAANLSFDFDALPMGRLGTPEEIAWVCSFLCTPAASYLSGAVIDVNGGNFVG